MNRRGIWVPVLVSALVWAVVLLAGAPAAVRGAIGWGLVISLAQAWGSAWSLRWAWNKPFFYWVWAGGVLARVVIFGCVFYVVYAHTALNLVAVMSTTAVATMVFLVVEALDLPRQV